MEPTSETPRWSRSGILLAAGLTAWAIFAILLPLLATRLNGLVLFGFPLGFYIAAQGSVVVFVILAFWHARWQDIIDRQHDATEET